MTATPFHGSDLEKIEQLYGIPKEKITGFGSNVNPLGLSPRLKEYLASRLDVLSSLSLIHIFHGRPPRTARSRCIFPRQSE